MVSDYFGTIKPLLTNAEGGAFNNYHYLKLTAEMFPELIKTVEETYGWVIPEAYHERD